MEKNIKLISQVLASFNGNLAQHNEIQRAWDEVQKALKAKEKPSK